ncbi:MAG: ABC transporter C-terminal domain-containing protein, partial [Cytophagales bacterium]
KTESQPAKPETKSKKGLSYNEKIELEMLPTEIEKLEAAKDELTAQLHAGTTDHAELTKLALQIQELSDSIETKTARWVELSEMAG